MIRFKYLIFSMLLIYIIYVVINNINSLSLTIMQAIIIGIALDKIREHYQLTAEKLKKEKFFYAEKKMKINNLRLEILKNYTSRKMSFDNLIYAIENKVESKSILIYREKYREEVLKWNISLKTINNELNLLKLDKLSKKYIEDEDNKGNTIQYKISESHYLLVSIINNIESISKTKIKEKLDKIKENLTRTSNLIVALNNELSKIEDQQKIKKEFMSQYNLEKASNKDLLESIFSKKLGSVKIKISELIIE